LLEAFDVAKTCTNTPSAAARKGAGSEGAVAKRIAKDQPSNDKLD
jgi:hypothetical protein